MMAGNLNGTNLAKPRFMACALLGGERTSGAEAATRWWVYGAWRLSLQEANAPPPQMWVGW